MIRKLADDGKTILISSHILTELAEICDMVGIIERGQLLAVGTVEQIQQKGQKQHNTVGVRVIGSATGLADWLAKNDGIDQIQLTGDTVRFVHAGDLEAEAALLRAMIDAGFRVVAFGSQRQTLEDIFMQVTEGLVQ